MTLRSTSNTHFVPDNLFVQFVSGELDHFDFFGVEAVAIYTDGRRETFDSTVTQAMLDDERTKLRAQYFADPHVTILAFLPSSVVIARKSFSGVISGWVA